MSAYSTEDYDDAYYAKVQTIAVLPKETADPKATPPVPPYFQMQVARGYLSSRVTQYTSFEFDALYPTMEHFSRSRIEAWYTKTPIGRWGPHVKDVLRIFVEYRVTGENDEGAVFLNSLTQHKKKDIDLVTPPTELLQKIPTLHIYQNPKNTLDRHYVFRQPDGRTVVVMCGLGCTGRTTWKGKLKLHYIFPEVRFSEMAEIDTAVNKLIDSFQPIQIK